MFNLLSGEFYKWRKSRSFKVCCLVITAFIVFIYGSLLMAGKIQKGEMENGSVGVVVENQSGSVLDGISALEMEVVIFNSVAGIVSAVFVCIFVIGEYGNGAIKNIVGKGTARGNIFLAKYIATIMAVMLILLLSAVVTLIGGPIFFGMNSINAEIMSNLWRYVGIQLLLWAAFAGIIVAIGEISRNLGVGISISVGALMLAGTLFSGIDLLLHKIDFCPSDYWVLNLVSECPTDDISRDFVIRVIIAVVFWIAVSVAAGMMHFKKADIK